MNSLPGLRLQRSIERGDSIKCDEYLVQGFLGAVAPKKKAVVSVAGNKMSECLSFGRRRHSQLLGIKFGVNPAVLHKFIERL